jgi:NAD(P)-dependent dehydrogenase (short-subunit alcohol dehydrogenase family)
MNQQSRSLLAEAHLEQSLASPLRDRTVVIFGGTSGIGLGAALQAKAAGAKIYVIGTDAVRAERAALENGLNEWRVADVTRSETVYEALADIPRVDHLVLVAGTFVAGKILEADPGYLRRAFDERVWASVHAIRALGDRLAHDGSITFISGQLADRPNAYGTAALASASAAMEALARGLALELAPRRVNTLAPGMIETPILDKALGEGRDAAVAAMRKVSPLRRMGTANEAGAAILFLMSNGFMNGETLHIDGGSRLV